MDVKNSGIFIFVLIYREKFKNACLIRFKIALRYFENTKDLFVKYKFFY